MHVRHLQIPIQIIVAAALSGSAFGQDKPPAAADVFQVPVIKPVPVELREKLWRAQSDADAASLAVAQSPQAEALRRANYAKELTHAEWTAYCKGVNLSPGPDVETGNPACVSRHAEGGKPVPQRERVAPILTPSPVKVGECIQSDGKVGKVLSYSVNPDAVTTETALDLVVQFADAQRHIPLVNAVREACRSAEQQQ